MFDGGWLEQLLASVSAISWYWGLALVFVLMFLNSSIMTPPSEFTCMYLGYLSQKTANPVLMGVFVVAIANMLGTQLWFQYGRYHRNKHPIDPNGWVVTVVHKMTGRQPSDLINSFENQGWWPAFSFRLIPVVRSIVSYSAGRSSLGFVPFLLASFSGIFIWCAGWVYIGFFLGSSVSKLAALPIFALIAILAFLMHKFTPRYFGSK